MENMTTEEKQHSIEAFLYIIHKSENALAHMEPGALLYQNTIDNGLPRL
jgi:hypothetical protein